MATPAVLQPVAPPSNQVAHNVAHRISPPHSDFYQVDLDTLVAAATERRKEGVVANEELKLDESFTRIDVVVDHPIPEQHDHLPSPDIVEHALQSHDPACDNDGSELHHSVGDHPHVFEHRSPSLSDPGHYTSSENPSYAVGQIAEHNGATGRKHAHSNASLSSVLPTRLFPSTVSSQQATDGHGCERLCQFDTAVKSVRREYGAVSDQPPPVPPKSSVHRLRRTRAFSVHSLASSSSTSDDNGKSRHPSVKSVAFAEQRPAYTMSDPGHGSTAAGPSRLPVNFDSQSVGHLRSVPVRQGTRSTWAYSDYPPLDVVLESQKQDGPVAFPTTSSYAGSVMSLSPRQTPPISTLGQDFSRYPAGLFDSLSRPRGVSTYSQASTTSRVTFSTLGHPHAGRASNKLRKTPGARRKSSLSISTTLASVMSDDVPPASPAALDLSQPLPHTSSPCLLTPDSSDSSSPKRRSPSPRSRQRKKSIFSRVFNFHRNRKSSAASRRNEKGYTVEPLQLPQAEQRISFPERPGSTEGGCEGTTLAGSGDWRECWWNEKSQSEDGHAYGRGRPLVNVLTLHPSSSASALPSPSTTATKVGNDATKGHTANPRLASGHGGDPSHPVRGSEYDSPNDGIDFRTRRQRVQAPADYGEQLEMDGRFPASLSPHMEVGGQRDALPRLPGGRSPYQRQPEVHQPFQPPLSYPECSQLQSLILPRPRPRVLVKRPRVNSIKPTSSRPKMRTQLSSGSSTEHTSSSKASSSGMWRGSLASTPSTSPGTSEAHSSSACPPARPQSYFAELQMQMRDTGEFDPSSFDSRYPRILSGSGNTKIGESAGGDSISTSALRARAQNVYGSPAFLSIMPAQTQPSRGPRSSTPARKLTKRRPEALKDGSPRAHNHRRSRSVTFDNAALLAALPASPPGIEVKPTSRGRPASREEEGEAEKTNLRSRARNRSMLKIKIRSPSGSRRVHEGTDEQADEKVNYLPQVRTLEPLWVGDGMMLSPYSRHTYHASSDSTFGGPPPMSSATDTLTSLAFTGNTGLLSSSALAALSSRLMHNERHGDKPARPASPFLISGKDTTTLTFDPYAEEKENKKAVKHDPKGSLRKKSKNIMYKSSFSFLRIDSTASNNITQKASPIPPSTSIPVELMQEEEAEKLDDLAALPLPTPRNRPRTRDADDSPLRRWTLAMTDVSDEVLVQELEKMRMEARAPSRRRRRGNPKSPTATSSSGGHTCLDSPIHSGEADQKAIVHGGLEEAQWREELVRLGISRAEEKPGEELDVESDDSHSESNELDDSPLEFNIDDAGWKSARRALLCCRELVRTERSYQMRLRQLLAGETDTPPPAVMLSYIPALLRASEALLARLEDDPSAWGVSAAFVGVEEEVEAAFIGWCGVVGFFFENSDASEDRPARKIVKSPKTSSIGRAESGSSGLGKRSLSSVSLYQTRPESIYPKRTKSFLEEGPAPKGPTIGMFTAALGTGLAYNIAPPVPTSQPTDEFGAKGAQKHDLHSQARGVHANAAGSGSLSLSKALKRMTVFSSAASLPPSAPVSPSSTPSTMTTSTAKKLRKEQKPTVRELAIQPTQRVMRYVLQYRDLLTHTPTESPSRGLVERALESALRIASKCDRAQGSFTFAQRV